MKLPWVIIIALASAAPAWADKAPAAGRWLDPVKVTGKIDDKSATAAMLIYVPRGYPAPSTKYPLVIALHGWNHSPELFRDKGELGRWADTSGAVIAVPAMATTVYETVVAIAGTAITA